MFRWGSEREREKDNPNQTDFKRFDLINFRKCAMCRHLSRTEPSRYVRICTHYIHNGVYEVL